MHLWKLGGGNSNIFNFHPYLGKIPILANIFQLGWNHQPEKCLVVIFCVATPPETDEFNEIVFQVSGQLARPGTWQKRLRVSSRPTRPWERAHILP